MMSKMSIKKKGSSLYKFRCRQQKSKMRDLDIGEVNQEEGDRYGN